MICVNWSRADYFMNGNKLSTVSEEKDLGVVVSDDLKWEKQSKKAVKKANRMLGVIKRSFTDRSKETIIPLYKSLVRPWNTALKYGVHITKRI